MSDKLLESKGASFRLSQLKRRAAENYYRDIDSDEPSDKIDNEYINSIVVNFLELGMTLADLQEFLVQTENALKFIETYAPLLLLSKEEGEIEFRKQIDELINSILDSYGNDDDLRQELSIDDIEPLCYRIFNFIERRIHIASQEKNWNLTLQAIDLLLRFSGILDQETRPDSLTKLTSKVSYYRETLFLGYSLASLEESTTVATL